MSIVLKNRHNLSAFFFPVSAPRKNKTPSIPQVQNARFASLIGNGQLAGDNPTPSQVSLYRAWKRGGRYLRKYCHLNTSPTRLETTSVVHKHCTRKCMLRKLLTTNGYEYVYPLENIDLLESPSRNELKN